MGEVERQIPNTQEGKNWTVVLFRCPTNNWTNILGNFVSFLESYEECMIPHYTIRQFLENSLIISVRVLRRPEDESLVKSRIVEFLKGYEYEIDPKQGDRFFYADWMGKQETSPKWTMAFCVILNRISKSVLDILNSATSYQNRLEWRHLFSNMMAIDEKACVFILPEKSELLNSIHFDHRNPQQSMEIGSYLSSLALNLLLSGTLSSSTKLSELEKRLKILGDHIKIGSKT